MYSHSNGNGSAAVDSGHEDRLLRLESIASEHGASVAELSVSMKFISQQVLDSKEELGSKIDQLTTCVEDSNRLITPRIDKLEQNEVRRDARLDLYKKAIWAIVLAGLGAGVKTVVPVLWTWLAR